MLIAQDIVERGMLDSMAAGLQSALQQVDYYVGSGNSKWVLVAFAVVMAIIFFKPKRR